MNPLYVGAVSVATAALIWAWRTGRLARFWAWLTGGQ